MSRCDQSGSFRYLLEVGTGLSSSRRLAVIQLNPSVASSARLDPTTGKILRWARERRFGSVIFLNIFAVRSPYPSRLSGKSYSQLLGTRNDLVISQSLRLSDTIVLAWGVATDWISASYYRLRLEQLAPILAARPLHRVGDLVKGLFPRHGNMWNGSQRTLRMLRWSTLKA